MIPSQHVFTCKEKDSVSSALALIVDKNISALVVLNEANFPLGIVTKSDLVSAYRKAVRLDDTVDTIMNQDLAWLNQHDSRDDAAKAIERTHKHHALVKDNSGNWVGLISSGISRLNVPRMLAPGPGIAVILSRCTRRLGMRIRMNGSWPLDFVACGSCATRGQEQVM